MTTDDYTDYCMCVIGTCLTILAVFIVLLCFIGLGCMIVNCI